MGALPRLVILNCSPGARGPCAVAFAFIAFAFIALAPGKGMDRTGAGVGSEALIWVGFGAPSASMFVPWKLGCPDEVISGGRKEVSNNVEALDGAVVLDRAEQETWLRATEPKPLRIEWADPELRAEAVVLEEMSPSDEKIAESERGKGSKSFQSKSVSDLSMSGLGSVLSKLTSEMGNLSESFFIFGGRGDELVRSLSVLLLDKLPSEACDCFFR